MNQDLAQTTTDAGRSIPDLIVEAAMVNPDGKSNRMLGSVPNDLLNTEWVQLRNLTDRAILLNGLELQHLVYSGAGAGKLTRVFQMQGQLPPNRRLRIHSGHGHPSFEKKRLTYHVFVNPNDNGFKYQIVKNDTIAIVLPNGSVVDQGHYQVPVEEGVKLVRVPPVVNQQLQMKVRDSS